MEEKRHLQKLIFRDIDAAASAYRAARSEARRKLQERLVETAPDNVASLVAELKRTRETAKRLENELSDLGYSFGCYQEKLSIGPHNKQPQELDKFDEETSRGDKSMSDLKRDYTLRLFAGGEEARALFATLASELAKIVS
jgi:hypothetical protein